MRVTDNNRCPERKWRNLVSDGSKNVGKWLTPITCSFDKSPDLNYRTLALRSMGLMREISPETGLN